MLSFLKKSVMIFSYILFFSIYFNRGFCSDDVAIVKLKLKNKSQNNFVSVQYYVLEGYEKKENNILPLVLISHAYSTHHGAYSGLGNELAKNGYFVVSIQHDVGESPVLASMDSILEKRKPVWEKGVKNILFVMEEIKTNFSVIDISNVTLIGHATGGDVSMLFAKKYPDKLKNIISLDSLKMPFPKRSHLKVLSLRASDTNPDSGVIPPKEEWNKYGMQVITFHDAKHADFSDKGAKNIQSRTNAVIVEFLREKEEKK